MRCNNRGNIISMIMSSQFERITAIDLFSRIMSFFLIFKKYLKITDKNNVIPFIYVTSVHVNDVFVIIMLIHK